MKTRTVLLCSLLLAVAVVAWAADISGKWISEMPGRDGGTVTTTYNFKVSGNTLTGTISSQRGDQDISEGKISGDEISFVTVREGPNGQIKITYKGKVSGNEIRLTRQFPEGMMGGRGGGGGGGGRGPQEIVLKRAN
ncbi:MAG: hypothetical protein ACUVXB_14265 [Bryobacteraceae bacterium]